MKLLLVDNVHIIKANNGNYYTMSIYDQSFFERYLNVFDSVRLVAKVKLVDEIDEKRYIHINFDNVEIYEITWYRGLKEFFKRLFVLSKEFYYAANGCDCIIYRVAQLESFMVYLFNYSKIFALEIVNNPMERKGKVIRSVSVYILKAMCKRAKGISYVTQKYLQELYPENRRKKAFTASYSTVELDESQIVEYCSKKLTKTVKLIHVANCIDGTGKGHDAVLRVIKMLKEDGVDAHIDFIGDGPGIDLFKQLANDLDVDQEVNFVGRVVDRNEYLKRLREADFLIFPSHSEGLPRVVIEAMASGLVCIASPVGGIPELLDEWCLIHYDDIDGYAYIIKEMIRDNALYNKVRKNNIQRVWSYERRILNEKRTKFYRKLMEVAKEI